MKKQKLSAFLSRFATPAVLIVLGLVLNRVAPSWATLLACLAAYVILGREVVMTLSDKRLNFFGPKGCSPNATAR